jgi:acetyltransferase-like isoleucine patch superfamily enzyme
MEQELTAEDLIPHGLIVGRGEGIFQRLRWEVPAYLFNVRRVKNCDLGAFSYINGFNSASLYETRIGRYCSIAEDVIVGPYEHPTDGLTSHSIAYATPNELPRFYHLPEYVRAAPDREAHPSFMDADTRTHVGHDVWLGAGCFVKRGVRIGNGAVVAAHAVVTRDVEPYAIVAGTPAKPLRKRFSDRVIDRMERVAWWQYDLAPFKDTFDWRDAGAALDAIERLVDARRVTPFRPDAWELLRQIPGARFVVQRLPGPLF